MNSRFSTESTGMDAKDYLDIDTRPSMSYLEPEHRPTDSYLELDDRPLKAYLEKESNAKNSHFNEQTNPEDSNLESKSRPPDPHLGLDSKPYLDLPDECKLIPTSQPTKCWIPGTNVYDTYYDDTVNFQNSPAQNGVSNQPPPCSSYPNPNPLPLNGTGRQGQALPAPPREAGLRTLESFNTKCMYNTMSRRTHFHGNTTDQETAIRELSKASSSCCCIRCRDVVWLILALLMTAACIGGGYYSTRIVLSQHCQSNMLNLGHNYTILYGEVVFNSTENTTKAFEQRFTNDVDEVMKRTVLSFFMNKTTVLGYPRDPAGLVCKFTLTLRVDESKRKGLQDFVRLLFQEKFDGQTPDGATLRCILIPKQYDASTYSCPSSTT